MNEIKLLLELIMRSRTRDYEGERVYTPHIDTKQVQRAHQELIDLKTDRKMIVELHNKLVLYTEVIEAAQAYIDYNETAADSYLDFRSTQRRQLEKYQELLTALEKKNEGVK